MAKIYLKVTGYVILSSILAVIVTRLAAMNSIDDHSNVENMMALAWLSIVFFLTYLVVNSATFIFLFLTQIDFDSRTTLRYGYLFIICFLVSTAVSFGFDWMYDVLVESDTSQYYAQILIYSLNDPGNTELNDMLLKTPFLLQNYVFNMIGILLSWVICIPVGKRFSRMRPGTAS